MVTKICWLLNGKVVSFESLVQLARSLGYCCEDEITNPTIVKTILEEHGYIITEEVKMENQLADAMREMAQNITGIDHSKASDITTDYIEDIFSSYTINEKPCPCCGSTENHNKDQIKFFSIMAPFLSGDRTKLDDVIKLLEESYDLVLKTFDQFQVKETAPFDWFDTIGDTYGKFIRSVLDGREKDFPINRSLFLNEVCKNENIKNAVEAVDEVICYLYP